MSHFTHWKVSQASKTLKPYDHVRVPHERKKESRKHEELPEGPAQPHGQLLQKGDGAQITEDKAKDMGANQSTEEDPALSKTEPRKGTKDGQLPLPLGPVYPPLTLRPSAKAGGRSRELSPPLAKNFRIREAHVARLPQQGPFRHFLDMKAEERLASWKERRSRYGDITVHKCYQLGQAFTPFRALATMEMRRLVFPQHLLMNLHTHKMGISCTDERNLQDSSLSSTKLGLGEEDSNHEKEKPASRIRTPLFPPIVKATKFHSMKK